MPRLAVAWFVLALGACGTDEVKPLAVKISESVDAPGVDAGPVCGVAPLPDCPLQGWMKANATQAISRRDLAALKRTFQRIGLFAPPGYLGWTEIAQRGEDAIVDAYRALHHTT